MTDSMTDGQTDMHDSIRPRLCTALRDKIVHILCCDEKLCFIPIC